MGFALLAGLLAGHWISGPRPGGAQAPVAPDPPLTSRQRRSASRFHAAALLFSVFGVALAFLYPWGAVFVELGWYGLYTLAIFALPVVVAFYYQWMKGAFEW